MFRPSFRQRRGSFCLTGCRHPDIITDRYGPGGFGHPGHHALMLRHVRDARDGHDPVGNEDRKMVHRKFGFCEFCLEFLFDFPIGRSGFSRGFSGRAGVRSAAEDCDQKDCYIKEGISHT